jgi:hypothetical protein
MRQHRLILVLLSTMALNVSLSYAVGVSALVLETVTNDSSVIVVGNVISVSEIGTKRVTIDSQEFPARVLIGVVHIDQVLKGTVSSHTVSFRFYVPGTDVGWESVAANTYGAFFFKPDTDGDLEFTNPYYPSVPAVSGSPVSGSTPIDRVMGALSAVIYSSETTLSQKEDAVRLLSDSKNPTSTTLLRSALSHTEEDIRLRAAAALLRRSDSSGLALAVQILSRSPSDIPQGNLAGLLYGIRELRDPNAVAALTVLVKSPSHEIREAVAEGLWRTHSQAAIVPLLSMLGDPDRNVRYYSVIGLAEVTGQLDWRPNPDDFAAFGTKYVQHWIEWGQSR